MDAVKIKVNGKTFSLKFGMKVFRLLSAAWNVPGMNAVFARLAVLESISDDVSFEQLDVINDLIIASVKANPDNTETITSEELDDLLLSDATEMSKIIETVVTAFLQSIPQPKEVETVGKKKAGNNPAK